jgi:hypothetical protein
MLPRNLEGALDEQQLQNVLAVAQMATQVEDYELAEDLHRVYVRRVPAEGLQLAAFLAMHGDADEAMEIMKQFFNSDMDSVLRLAAQMLRTRQAEVGETLGAEVDRLVAAGLRASEIGLELNWRVVPAGAELDGDVQAQLTATGGTRALKPLSPVHLRMRREETAAVFFWIQRGRIDADSWAGTDIPLGEEREAYALSFSLPGGPALRSAEVGEAEFIYPLAEIEADFGTMPQEIEMSVRQISQAAGPGLPAIRRFALT